MDVMQIFAQKCGNIETVILPCSAGISSVFVFVLNLLSIGVAIAAMIGIVATGIQWMTAGDDVSRAIKARRRLVQVVLGLGLYAGMYVGLNFIVPGGVLNPEELYSGLMEEPTYVSWDDEDVAMVKPESDQITWVGNMVSNEAEAVAVLTDKYPKLDFNYTEGLTESIAKVNDLVARKAMRNYLVFAVEDPQYEEWPREQIYWQLFEMVKNPELASVKVILVAPYLHDDDGKVLDSMQTLAEMYSNVTVVDWRGKVTEGDYVGGILSEEGVANLLAAVEGGLPSVLASAGRKTECDVGSIAERTVCYAYKYAWPVGDEHNYETPGAINKSVDVAPGLTIPLVRYPKPAYREALDAELGVGEGADPNTIEGMSRPGTIWWQGASCDVFVSVVMRSVTKDTGIRLRGPGIIGRHLAERGWVNLGEYDGSFALQPGDVMVVATQDQYSETYLSDWYLQSVALYGGNIPKVIVKTQSGTNHIQIYVGESNGRAIIAQAQHQAATGYIAVGFTSVVYGFTVYRYGG